MKAYTSINEKIQVASDKVNILPQVDTLVFDIDGVILDVRLSFRVAISQTVQFYFSSILKWPGQTILISPEETQLFKLAGGFNNDWELTYAVVLFYLAKDTLGKERDLGVLRKKDPSLEDFTSQLKVWGGGLGAAERLTLQEANEEKKQWIRAKWDKALIKRIFQEHYGGVDYCRKLYGFEPTYLKERGLIGKEKVLVDVGLVKPWCSRVGIVTGRTSKEAEVALGISGLWPLLEKSRIVADEGVIRKPNPEVLVKIAEEIGTKVGIYLGDTPDDLQTVKNFEQLGIPSSFISCIIIHRRAETKFYLSQGVDVLADDVNEVLSFLREAKKLNE